jgi:hypothetical protein
VVAVADHQTATGLIDLVGELLDVGGDLGPQGGREHLLGAVTDDLIEQRRAARRAARRAGLDLVMNYLEHERTFPNRHATAGPDQTCYLLWAFRSSSGGCTLLHVPAEGHPQVLIIARIGDVEALAGLDHEIRRAIERLSKYLADKL